VKDKTKYEEAMLEVDFEVESYENYSKSVVIDRNKEDKTVMEFQKTGDVEILDSVFKARIGTLWKWAIDNYYPSLTCSVEDLFGDLTCEFVKAAQKFDKKRGTFNTCLYNFLLNRIKNIKNGVHANKRTSKEYKGPLSGMTLSLDYSYNHKDGGEITLKDIIADKQYAKGSDGFSGMHLSDTLDILARDNSKLKNFLAQVSGGNSVVSLIKEAKTKRGYVRLNKDQAQSLKRARNKKRFVMDLLKYKKRREIDVPFQLLAYNFSGSSKLEYAIELKKTEESSMLTKAIRNLRRNRDDYVMKIRGVN